MFTSAKFRTTDTKGIEINPKNKFYEVKICMNLIDLRIRNCLYSAHLVLACAIINNHRALPNAILSGTFGTKKGALSNPV
ncbi:MAG: hypothetical protein L3J74_08375 [Bacteroidales bacterium]|nr:hypothetical protein [Bacteroidales bacterium]